ncbi:hypothetical protein [Paenibacillus melissococcoides]|nr:hypothetical protein [Paenibacillus melissococcoides]CAH8715986.1 hypothetical protein HTL2_004466 [Paenibacillus melissococcoides]
MSKSPYDIRAIFDEMTINLVNSMRRNLSRHKTEEQKVGFQFEQWQRAKLRNLRQYRKTNKRIV